MASAEGEGMGWRAMREWGWAENGEWGPSSAPCGADDSVRNAIVITAVDLAPASVVSSRTTGFSAGLGRTELGSVDV